MLQHEKQNCVQPPRAEAIAQLNDTLRKTGSGGTVMVTQSVMRLAGFDAAVLAAALAEYDGLDADNDPQGERDFGDLTCCSDTLAVKSLSLHSFSTCGQSRRGGLVTSNSRRRSSFLGRVAVTHVQGSPKGGGALGLLRVTNTRLASVPPHRMEALMQTAGRFFEKSKSSNFAMKLAVALIATLSPTAAEAQSILGAIARALATKQQQQASQDHATQDTLTRVRNAINVAPERACELPQTDIQRWLSAHINDQGLMDNIDRTVFHREPNATPQDPIAALNQRVREGSARQEAKDRAAMRALETGQQVPVGGAPPAVPQNFDTNLTDIKAISRIDGGLNCGATANAGALRIDLTYTLTLDPNQSDGWNSELQLPPPNEAQALADSSTIRIAYNSSELSLAQARAQSANDIANENAAVERARQQTQAEEARRNSPAGRVAAAVNSRALSAEYRRRGLACQNSGGTWGVRWDNNTVVEVSPGTIPAEFARISLGCYHL